MMLITQVFFYPVNAAENRVNIQGSPAQLKPRFSGQRSYGRPGRIKSDKLECAVCMGSSPSPLVPDRSVIIPETTTGPGGKIVWLSRRLLWPSVGCEASLTLGPAMRLACTFRTFDISPTAMIPLACPTIWS
jgi:hypothetical protein